MQEQAAVPDAHKAEPDAVERDAIEHDAVEHDAVEPDAAEPDAVEPDAQLIYNMDENLFYELQPMIISSDEDDVGFLRDFFRD